MKRLSYLFLGICFMMYFPSAWADGEKDDSDKTLSPYFFIENGDPEVDSFPLKSTNVDAIINGVIADVTVTQTYKNDGKRPINAKYIFPASTRASVHGMKMIIGDQVITAKIKERKEAKQTFEKAKKQGKSASLLEQQRPNVFSMNVVNIMPGDTVDIELRYTELLIPTDGTYAFVYPTVVGPRYSNQPEASAPESDKWVKSPYLKEGEQSKTVFNITTSVSTGIPLQELACTTHKTHIEWENKTIAKVSLAGEEKFGGNRDYILKYRLMGKQIESGLMLYEGKDENFFLLMAQPPERVQPKDIPPREYIFVVDVSGSMSGFPLTVSKKLLEDLIGNLKATDTFNVILFAGSSQLMASSSVPATEENINRAIRVIDSQRGGGGTELYPAMEKALKLPYDESTSRSILIITDGYISAERQVFELIDKNLGKANVFAFGIGSSVNRYLIEGMAKAGHGDTFVVTDRFEAPAAATTFKEYIQSPVLTGIKVDFDGFDAYAVEPSSVPDMFAKRPVIIFGKWKGGPKGVIEITGTSGKGEYRKEFDVSDTEPMELNSALKYLWARKRIEKLSDHNFGRQDSENKAEIVSLGLTYNLLTQHTSFVAVREKIVNTQGPAKDVKQPLPLPKGVSNLAVGGTMANTPEPEMVFLLLIIFMIAIVAALRRYKNRVCL